ncbi:MAG: hypothetical protein R3C49_25150 [Planctomycetaceae bacterium]
MMTLFDWVIQTVALLPADVRRPPMGLFEVMLSGRGTANDRAWVFAEALRQEQLDGVIIATKAEPAEDGNSQDLAPWLFAALTSDGVLLFDMTIGLPVTADGKADLLKPTAGDLAVLKDHERWKDSTVQPIAQAAAFAPRMMILQDQLAADDAAVLFEELTGGVSRIRPIVDRILDAGKGFWTRDDISVWPYPEQQVVASSALSEQQQQELANLLRPFDAPFERPVLDPPSAGELTSVPEELGAEERQQLAQNRIIQQFERMNQSSEAMFGKPSRRLLKARIEQLLGHTDTGVIQQLQQIRIAGMQEFIRIAIPQQLQESQGYPPVINIPLPAFIREVNESSTGNSLYWTGLCQLDRGEAGAAITTLRNYRRNYPEGRWRFAAMFVEGMASLREGRRDAAIEALKEADSEGNPERRRAQVMLKSLSAE